MSISFDFSLTEACKNIAVTNEKVYTQKILFLWPDIAEIVQLFKIQHALEVRAKSVKQLDYINMYWW